MRTLLDIFVAPRRAFDAIRPDLPVYPPMMLLVGAAVLVGVAYAASIDTHAVVDAFRAEMPEPRPARDTLVSALNVLVAAIPALAAAYVLMTLLAFGLCLWIVGKVVRDGSSFRAAMSLACWASVPGVIHSLAATVAVPLAPSDVSSFEGVILASATYPLNLGELGVDSTLLGGVPSFINLTDFWIAALVAIGYQRWYRTHIAQAVTVAIIPFALLAALVFGPLSWMALAPSDMVHPAPTGTEHPLPTP